jgi:hypothetical protein
MTPTFAIRSCTSDRSLQVSEAGHESFTAELLGTGLSATLRVSTHTDAEGLSLFFGRLASQEQPWHGIESWESLEGEFRIMASCSSLGEVHFEVGLRFLQGAPEEWSLSAGLLTELGQLPIIARNAALFFSGAHT